MSGRGGGRGRGGFSSVEPAQHNFVDHTPVSFDFSNGSGASQLVGKPSQSTQMMVSPAFVAQERLKDRLSKSLDDWSNSPMMVLVQLIGDKAVEWSGSYLDALLQKRSKLTKKVVATLSALGLLYYIWKAILKRRQRIEDFLLSFAMTRVTLPPEEYNLNYSLPGWIRAKGFPLRRETSVTLYREYNDSAQDTAGAQDIDENGLLFRGDSRWLPFFYKWKFFLLRRGESSHNCQDQKAPSDRNNIHGDQNNYYDDQNYYRDQNNDDSTNERPKETPVADHPGHTLWCLWGTTYPSTKLLEVCEHEVTSGYVEVFRAVVEAPAYLNGHWAEQPQMPARSMDSIYLDAAVKERLVRDIARYVGPKARKFYNDRGIPHRRGYLLYGSTGCGKTSAAIAIAAEFKFRTCTISLLDRGMTDAILLDLIRGLPPRSLLLLEDVDCVGLDGQQKQPAAIIDSEGPLASAQSTARPTPLPENSGSDPAAAHSQSDLETSTGDTNSEMMGVLEKMAVGGSNPQVILMLHMMKEKEKQRHDQQKAAKAAKEKRVKEFKSTVTLSGLLNAIDGVASPQGYVLMMTTNHKDSLDPALVRAGRVDMKIEFERASREQAQALFINMYKLIETDEKDWEPPFDVKEIPRLASEFASRVPPREVTCAQLQQFTLLHQSEPGVAVEKVAGWIEEQLREEEEDRAKALALKKKPDTTGQEDGMTILRGEGKANLALRGVDDNDRTEMPRENEDEADGLQKHSPSETSTTEGSPTQTGILVATVSEPSDLYLP